MGLSHLQSLQTPFAIYSPFCQSRRPRGTEPEEIYVLYKRSETQSLILGGISGLRGEEA